MEQSFKGQPAYRPNEVMAMTDDDEVENDLLWPQGQVSGSVCCLGAASLQHRRVRV